MHLIHVRLLTRLYGTSINIKQNHHYVRTHIIPQTVVKHSSLLSAYFYQEHDFVQALQRSVVHTWPGKLPK